MSATARQVPVELGERRYTIEIGTGLIDRVGELCAPLVPGRRVIVVTDEIVAALHLDRVLRSLAAAGLRTGQVIVPPGEGSKEFGAFGRLMEALLDQRPDRGTMLVALGGGVVGDLAGFAAAVLLRGVDFIQIPTTLLAQVDSSVGGKTGINTRHGKNLIGSFHQPRLVIADVAALDTLPRRELLAGYAEVVKYGLIDDAAFFGWLEQHGRALLDGDHALRIEAVTRSCAAKARVVAGDERETGDLRALLNLGHTFAHALEKETGYGPDLLHGEAVGIGLVMAFDMSAALGLCPAADAARVRRHLDAVGLATSPRAIPGDNARTWDAARLVEHMRGDKKNRDGRITFVLAHGIGKAFVARGVDETPALDTIRRALAA